MAVYIDKIKSVALPEQAVSIAPTAVLIGQVEIGGNSSVSSNSVIRGDSHSVVIGSNSTVLENCFIKDSAPYGVTVGNHVTIGHRSVLQGCTVQDEAVIGAGVLVMEGASIGSGALIFPGSVVARGTVIPPNSMFMGIPGKIVSNLKYEEVSEMKKKWMLFEHRDDSLLDI